MPRLGTSINIPFNGIERVRPTNSDGSGSCSDIINLRQRGGAWEPTMSKKVQQVIVGVDAVYFHSKLEENERVVLKDYSGTKKLVFYDGAAFDLGVLEFELNSGESIGDYVELGNYLSFTTNERHFNLLWDGSLYALSEHIDLSELSLNTGSNYIISTGGGSGLSTVREMNSAMEIGRIGISDLYGIDGTAATRVAIKLTDGRYVYQSGPLVAFNPEYDSDARKSGVFFFRGSEFIGTNGLGYNLEAKRVILTVTQDEFDLLDNEFVEAVAVCITKPISRLDGFDISDLDYPDFDYSSASYDDGTAKLEADGFVLIGEADDPTTDASYFKYPSNDDNDPSNILDDGNYYILKEIPIDELSVGENIIMEDLDYSALDILEIDTTRYHEALLDGSMDVYNKRIHLFDYKRELARLETFVSGYFTITAGDDSGGSVAANYYAEVIVFENGINNKITKLIGTGAAGEGCYFNTRLLSYLNVNATKLRVWGESADGLYKSESSYTLTSHSELNFSYLCNYNASSELFNTIDGSTVVFSVGIDGIDNEIYAGILNNEDNIIVSDQNYPDSYDSINSYSFGDGEIIAISAPTFPLSEGQFGSFPLYIFTSQGIWALSSGSGDVLYSTSTPVGREVLMNRKAAIGTEIGIIFLSKGGLNVLSGSNTKPLSLSLSGNPESLIDSIDYKLYLGSNQGLTIDPDGLYNSYPKLYQYVDDVDFLDYIEDGDIVVGYAYGKDFKDILITNISKDESDDFNYGYSYVFDTLTGLFHKITEVFDYYDDQYPELYGVTIVDNVATVSNASEESGSEYRDVMIETRAQLFDTDRFKKIYRSILRSYIKPHEFDADVNSNFSNVRCLSSVFAVMLSLDSKNWEIFDTENRSFEYTEDDLNKAYVDFRITGGVTKDLYFKYLFVGSLDEESSISGLAMEVDEEPTKMME